MSRFVEFPLKDTSARVLLDIDTIISIKEDLSGTPELDRLTGKFGVKKCAILFNSKEYFAVSQNYDKVKSMFEFKERMDKVETDVLP